MSTLGFVEWSIRSMLDKLFRWQILLIWLQ